MKALLLLPLAFMNLPVTPEYQYAYQIGYYDGWDDAQALFAEAMVTLDDREASGGIILSKEQYRACLRAAVGHVNPRSNKRIKKMLEGE